MIVRAALCPSPPLLGLGVSGQVDVLPELREACEAAVGWLLAAAPDAVTVIGPAATTATWPPDSAPDLPRHAPALNRLAHPADAPPLSLAIGAQLLDAAGYRGPRVLQSVAESAAPDACRDLGRDLAADAPLTALLVIGDGSARRSVAAPGYLDERAEPFDTVVEQALRDGDLPALAALDPNLARDLLAAGRPAWQALAAALAPARPRTRILYSDAPFGVTYLVATLDPSAPSPRYAPIRA
ncbi:MAG TPA: hypothetical protein VH021_19115 [Trebonia sp.]|nr:hypothetical protein [Trebonia sp.]